MAGPESSRGAPFQRQRHRRKHKHADENEQSGESSREFLARHAEFRRQRRSPERQGVPRKRVLHVCCGQVAVHTEAYLGSRIALGILSAVYATGGGALLEL